MDEEQVPRIGRSGEHPGPVPAPGLDSGSAEGILTPSWAVPGVDRDSVLAEGLALLSEGLDVLRAVGSSGWCVGDVAIRDTVRDLDAVRHQIEHVWLGLVHELDGRPEAVPGTRAGQVAQGFLTGGLNRSPGQARRDVAAARALFRGDADRVDADRVDPDGADVDGAGTLTHPQARLHDLGQLFEAGQVSREHLDAAVDCLKNVPRHLARAVDEETGLSGTERVDAFMAEKSRQFDPRILRRLAKHLLAVLDPEGQKSGFDPDAYLRRDLRLTEAPDGMTLIRGQVDAAAAVWLKAALDNFCSPERNPEPVTAAQGELPVEVKDERTPGQRQADALIAIARRALDTDDSTVRREPAHVLILATPGQVADAHTRPAPGRAVGLAEIAKIGPVPPDVLALLTCDALLQAVVLGSSGAVLQMDLGNTRTASRAQRRALAARDRGCIYPGCPAKPADCDAHHIEYWSAGGPTSLTNQGLLCPRHHTEVHLGLFTVTVANGVPHVRVPGWHHLARGPSPSSSRNRLHDAIAGAQKLAQQLRLDLAAERPASQERKPPDAEAA